LAISTVRLFLAPPWPSRAFSFAAYACHLIFIDINSAENRPQTAEAFADAGGDLLIALEED
jgi:hypothetical protein